MRAAISSDPRVHTQRKPIACRNRRAAATTARSLPKTRRWSPSPTAPAAANKSQEYATTREANPNKGSPLSLTRYVLFLACLQLRLIRLVLPGDVNGMIQRE